ncbi:putative uncharacterized protein [Mycolicibacterium canariasense]|nr:hypothetical protein AWB94_00225 [Mycolicibacterium canariasense]GAS96871.1 putative uncharacterized protein [Mycolicibacterium canariasense]
MPAADTPSRLDTMNLYEYLPQTMTFVADDGRRFGAVAFHPWFLLARLIVLALVVTAIWLIARRLQGRKGENTLRDVYARGEVGEAEYRERLAVLRATRR